MSQTNIDQAREIRKGEQLDLDSLNAYLVKNAPDLPQIAELRQFPGGFSNLTYLLVGAGNQEYVLRRPPFGANIKSAHDMSREFKVLQALEKVGARAPRALHYCAAEDSPFEASFYIMERVRGVIMRPVNLPKPIPSPTEMRAISEALIDNLVSLHQIDLEASGLAEMGRPDGYTERQVHGWIKRYHKAETDDIEGMKAAEKWLLANIPTQPEATFIHNDYKYDNLVLNPEDMTDILAVLDWEMATVGNPLMDLGSSLSYWVEAEDNATLRMFNLTHLPGNMTRQEVVDRYAAQSGRDTTDILFYYVFGTYKLGVIAQQIYARFKKGYTKDPRFAMLIHAVNACAGQAVRALEKGRI